MKNLECSICGKGVRHLKDHLTLQHRLVPGSKKYKIALGRQPEKSRHVGKKAREELQEKQRLKNGSLVSINRWIEHESRGETKIDASGMRRNIKLVLQSCKNLTDLVSQNTAEQAYKRLYEHLRNKKYKYNTINLILGTLKKFIDWVCSETNLRVAKKSRREHEYYTKTCRRRGKMEDMQRKVTEYIPTVGELKPLIDGEKHQQVVDGLLQDPRKILRCTGVDLVHATMAWPLLLNCGVRTGVIRNMLVSEVLQAKVYNSRVIVHVKDHKTADHYGPYRIILKLLEYTMIVNYIKNRSEESAYVFCTKQGKQSSYASVARKMKSLFKLYGLERLKINTMRKFITTQVHKSGNEISIEATANLLKHSVRTARRDYKAKQQDVDALKAAKSISNTIKEQMAAAEQENTEVIILDEERQIVIPDNPRVAVVSSMPSSEECTFAANLYAPDKVETHVTPFVIAHLNISYDPVTSKEEKEKDGSTATPVDEITEKPDVVDDVRDVPAETLVTSKEEKEKDAATATPVDEKIEKPDVVDDVPAKEEDVEHDSKITPKIEKLLIDLTQNSDDDDEPAPKITRQPRRYFDPRHTLLIKCVFAADIMNCTVPSREKIKGLLESELREIAGDRRYHSKSLPTKIYESVRAQVRLSLGRKKKNGN